MREKAAVQKQKAETRNKAMEALVNKTLQKQERQCCKKPSTIWNQQTIAEAVSSMTLYLEASIICSVSNQCAIVQRWVCILLFCIFDGFVLSVDKVVLFCCKRKKKITDVGCWPVHVAFQHFFWREQCSVLSYEFWMSHPGRWDPKLQVNENVMLVMFRDAILREKASVFATPGEGF